MRNAKKITAVTALSLTLAACGGSSPPDTYEVDEESGEVNATITTDEGTATIRAGEDVPVDLPMGFTVYPDAEVTNNVTFEQEEATVAMINIESEAAVEEMAAHYRKQAEEAGFAIKLEMKLNDGTMLGGEAADGRTFSFNGQPGEEGAKNTAQISLSQGVQ